MAAHPCVRERGMLCPFAHQTGAFKPWNRLLGEVVDAPSLSVSTRHLDNALNNMLRLLVSPEVGRRMD